MGHALCDHLSAGARAGLIAALPSGIPSTAHAAATGGDLLAATRAAGSLVVGERAPRWLRLAAALPVHLGLSAGWGAAMRSTLPRQWLGRPLLTGAAAGLTIAAIDLGLVGRRRPAIRSLPLGPQVADHVVFGAVAAWVLARRFKAGTSTLTRVSAGLPAPVPAR